MLKRILLALSLLVISVIGFFGYVWYDLENEKFHPYPCESSPQYLLDSLGNSYNIWNSSYSPKNYYAKSEDYDHSKVNCKIINCAIAFKEPEINFENDSLVMEILNTFWSFRQNKLVDSFYLTIKNGHKQFSLQSSKLDIEIGFNPMEYDTFSSWKDFKIVRDFKGQESGGGGEYEKYSIKTRSLYIESNIDLKKYDKVVDYFYNKELKNCKVENVATFTIHIVTKKPKGALINKKEHQYIFNIIARKEYSKKK